MQFKQVPCSCQCGGSMAWVLEDGNKQLMIGCVCHTIELEIPESVALVKSISMVYPYLEVTYAPEADGKVRHRAVVHESAEGSGTEICSGLAPDLSVAFGTVHLKTMRTMQRWGEAR